MRIAETFASIQGEGDLSGVPMFFVRAAGCSVATCPLHPATTGLCDTDWSFREERSTETLATEALDSGLHWVCITGGEPTDQMGDIVELAARCHKNNQQVMLQTSGVRAVPDCWDWLVVSPKQHHLEMRQRSGHELKLVWGWQPWAIDFAHLSAIFEQTHFLRYFIQPLCRQDGSANLSEVAAVVQRCGKIGLPWRLGVQQHKLWGGQ